MCPTLLQLLQPAEASCHLRRLPPRQVFPLTHGLVFLSGWSRPGGDLLAPRPCLPLSSALSDPPTLPLTPPNIPGAPESRPHQGTAPLHCPEWESTSMVPALGLGLCTVQGPRWWALPLCLKEGPTEGSPSPPSPSSRPTARGVGCSLGVSPRPPHVCSFWPCKPGVSRELPRAAPLGPFPMFRGGRRREGCRVFCPYSHP